MAKFLYGIDHGQDVLGWNVVHHCVYRADHATTTGAQYLHDPTHLFADLIDGAKWEYSIPYVHRFEIFEMPLVGYAGYLPFGLECAVVAALFGLRINGRRSTTLATQFPTRTSART